MEPMGTALRGKVARDAGAGPANITDELALGGDAPVAMLGKRVRLAFSLRRSVMYTFSFQSVPLAPPATLRQPSELGSSKLPGGQAWAELEPEHRVALLSLLLALLAAVCAAARCRTSP